MAAVDLAHHLGNEEHWAELLGPCAHKVITRQEVAAGLKGSGARTGLLILAATNAVMVAIMAIAPVQLVAHDHSLGLVGTVVAIHVAGMFVPSPVSGWLTVTVIRQGTDQA